MSLEKVVYCAWRRSNFWAERGKEIIDEDYSSLEGIGQVCSALGISEGHFRDLFQSAFGVTPKLYLETVQVEHSKELLVHHSLMVHEIGEMVGFKHRWAFQRTFKKLTGYYPSEYRKIKMKTARVSKITREI